MGGYLQLLGGVFFLILLFYFVRIKIETVSREKSKDFSSLPPAISRLAYCQYRVRYYSSMAIAGFIGLLVIGTICAGGWKSMVWLGFSIGEAKSGYDALWIIVWNVIKIGVLAGIIYFLIRVYIPFVPLAFFATYYYLVFGSLLQVPFIFHWIMTGHYYTNWLHEDDIWITLSLGVINLILSDVGDITVFILDSFADSQSFE